MGCTAGIRPGHASPLHPQSDPGRRPKGPEQQEKEGMYLGAADRFAGIQPGRPMLPAKQAGLDFADPDPNVDMRRAHVRNMRSKCRYSYVLQFTLHLGAGSVLHRPPSQMIHCAVLCFGLQPSPVVEWDRFPFHGLSLDRMGERSKSGGESL